MGYAQAKPHSAFHFQPGGWAVPITIIYPLPQIGASNDKQLSNQSATQQSDSIQANPEAQLADTRAELHACLGLPGGSN